MHVTGFWKTNQIVTLDLIHFIGSANSYTHALPIRSANTRLDSMTGSPLLSEFFRPCKLMTETMGPMEGTTRKAWV